MTLLADDDLAGLTVTDAFGRPSQRRWTTFEPNDLPRAGTLDEQLRAELACDEGTPEWRAFVARACERHHIT